MGFFDNLFGRRPAKPLTSDELRESLITAALEGNKGVMRFLFETYPRDIEEHCEGWTKVPQSVRSDRAALERYTKGLIAAAVALAELGQLKLLERLKGGGPEDNPLTRWEQVMTRAQSLMREWKYEEADRLLENQLIDSRELIGTGPERYRSITLGLISQCRFHRGEVEASLAPAQTALQICEKSGDLEGVVAYVNTLVDIRRYLGQTVESAGLMDRLAEVHTQMGNPAEAGHWTRRASLVRSGEPLCRVLIVVGDRAYEVEDAPLAEHITFTFERNRLTLGRSEALMKKGREHGSAGRTEEALSLFREAGPLDPYNPEPHYQAGVALMSLGQAADAAEEFQATEELAPGWFHCRADLWLARQIALGDLPPEVFVVLRALEDAPGTPEQKLSIAGQAVEKFADVAPFHLQHGMALGDTGRSDLAIAAFRKGVRIAREPDIRTRLLTQLAGALSPGPERTSSLKEAAELRGNLVAAATAAYMLRHGV